MLRGGTIIAIICMVMKHRYLPALKKIKVRKKECYEGTIATTNKQYISTIRCKSVGMNSLHIFFYFRTQTN